MESSRLGKTLWATYDRAKWKNKYEISSVGIFIVRDGEWLSARILRLDLFYSRTTV
jgi:hypothetical protein